MSIKKTIIIVGIALLGVGGTATYFVTQDESAVEFKKVEKMSEKEQSVFLDTLLEKVSAGEKPSEVESALAEKVKGLSKENASEGIYLLLSSLAIEQSEQMANYRTVGDGVVDAYEKEQFKSVADESYSKVEDKAVQGFLQELKRQHLILQDDGEGLYLAQDLNYIADAYEPYMSESLQGVLEVRLLNQEKPYVNGSQTAYDMEMMLERVLLIEGKKDNWKDTIYESEMMSLQEQAYMDFFGLTHETYFETKNANSVMKEDVKEKMYLLQAEYANSFMGEDIIGFMAELELNGFEKKDSQEFAYSKLIERFSVDVKEQTPIIMNPETIEEGAE